MSRVSYSLRNLLVVLVASALTLVGLSSPASANGNPIVNIEYAELDFNYTAGNYENIVGNGKVNGDQVLFKNVITALDANDNPVSVDALVTTTLVNANVKNYESGTSAGGDATNFQVDLGIDSAYGYGAFTFDFYKNGTYGTTNEQVTLQNVQMTGIDIDYNQFNVFTGIQGYTVSNPTNLIPQNPSTYANLTMPITTFPTDILFQGPSSIGSNIPEDQVVVTYGELSTVTIRFGSKTTGQTNYFGVAFKALSFGSTPVSDYGTSYTLTYDINNGTGTTPAPQTGVLGEIINLAGPGNITHPQNTFVGWNTEADGSGTFYSFSSPYTMPKDGATLYAQWDPYPQVSFKANGGTGVMSDQISNTSTPLNSNTFTREGYTFSGWNTAADGSGTSYANNENYPFTSTATLYAQWTANPYTLTYNANNGNNAPADQPGVYDEILTISSDEPSRTGYTFTGWNTAADGTGTDYAVGDPLTLTNNTTLYAQWNINSYTVSYDANEGTGTPTSQTDTFGSTINLSTDEPTREGYTFTGWNTIVDGSGTDYTAGDTITLGSSNIVLYAQWSRNPAPPAPPAPPVPTNTDTTPIVPKPTPIETPNVPLPPAPVEPEETRVTTTQGDKISVSPLTNQAPPQGEEWDYSTMRIVNPNTGEDSTRVKTKQGTWTVNTTTGTVVFTPRKNFVGTASLEYRVAATNGAYYTSKVSATITKKKTRKDTVTVYFDSGSPVLTKKAKKQLNALVKRVDKKSSRVLFGEAVGYVQATTYTGNDMSLSAARARNIRNYLIKKGIKPISSYEGLGKAKEKGWKARRARATITYVPK